jgi:hypothetical protein
MTGPKIPQHIQGLRRYLSGQKQNGHPEVAVALPQLLPGNRPATFTYRSPRGWKLRR